jgi:hypothetical protein
VNGPAVLSAVAVLGGLVALAGYALACLVWPFAACRRCHGDGKSRSPSGRTWRACKRCKGTGRRLRVGRHVVNYLRRTQADANR